MNISQSIIKLFLKKGEEQEICPRFIKYIEIDGRASKIPTDSMLYGQYFETLCLGSCSNNIKVTDLKRKRLKKHQLAENEVLLQSGQPIKHIGEKTANQLRIEHQAMVFKQLIEKYNIYVLENNTQIKIYKRWLKDPNIILSGELDIFPTSILFRKDYNQPLLPGDENDLKLAIIDLKLTWDINSEWGDFCWGKPQFLDTTQGVFYHYLVRDMDLELNPHLKVIYSNTVRNLIDSDAISFYYWVFDYNSKSVGNKFVEVSYNSMKEAELNESIRKVVTAIELYDKEGWSTNPSFDRCTNCPLICKDRINIQTV